MRGREIRNALHKGVTVFGTLIVSPSPVWPKVVQTMGLDFLFIDTEHIAIDRSTISWMCRTYDDFGGQNGLFFSPETWREILKPAL